MKKEISIMTKEEFLVFRDLIGKLRPRISGDMAKMSRSSIRWKKMKSGNIGCYSHTSKKLFINEEHKDDPVEFLISTIAHELHHMWQHQKYGWLYFFFCNPLLRFFVLEPSAIKLEKEVDELMGMGGIRDEDKGSGII